MDDKSYNAHFKVFKVIKSIMKTGIELIKKEREEQIHKHGFSLQKDAEFYKNGELMQASDFCLEQARIKAGIINVERIKWPDGWGEYFEQKIRNKSVIDQLTVCGAFILAEKDRTNDNNLDIPIDIISKKIDNLIIAIIS